MFNTWRTSWVVNHWLINSITFIRMHTQRTQRLFVCTVCQRKRIRLFPQVLLLLFYLVWIIYGLEWAFNFMTHSYSFHLCILPLLITPSRCQRNWWLLLINTLLPGLFLDLIHHHGHDQLVLVVPTLLLLEIGMRIWVFQKTMYIFYLLWETGCYSWMYIVLSWWRAIASVWCCISICFNSFLQGYVLCRRDHLWTMVINMIKCWDGLSLIFTCEAYWVSW